VTEQLPPSGISWLAKNAGIDRMDKGAKDMGRNVMMWTMKGICDAADSRANEMKRPQISWEDLMWTGRHHFPAIAARLIVKNTKYVAPDPNAVSGKRKKGGGHAKDERGHYASYDYHDGPFDGPFYGDPYHPRASARSGGKGSRHH
jgi:hypothetical protein